MIYPTLISKLIAVISPIYYYQKAGFFSHISFAVIPPYNYLFCWSIISMLSDLKLHLSELKLEYCLQNNCSYISDLLLSKIWSLLSYIICRCASIWLYFVLEHYLHIIRFKAPINLIKAGVFSPDYLQLSLH